MRSDEDHIGVFRVLGRVAWSEGKCPSFAESVGVHNVSVCLACWIDDGVELSWVVNRVARMRRYGR